MYRMFGASNSQTILTVLHSNLLSDHRSDFAWHYRRTYFVDMMNLKLKETLEKLEWRTACRCWQGTHWSSETKRMHFKVVYVWIKFVWICNLFIKLKKCSQCLCLVETALKVWGLWSRGASKTSEKGWNIAFSCSKRRCIALPRIPLPPIHVIPSSHPCPAPPGIN